MEAAEICSGGANRPTSSRGLRNSSYKRWLTPYLHCTSHPRLNPPHHEICKSSRAWEGKERNLFGARATVAGLSQWQGFILFLLPFHVQLELRYYQSTSKVHGEVLHNLIVRRLLSSIERGRDGERGRVVWDTRPAAST